MAKRKRDKLDDVIDQLTENAAAEELLNDPGFLKGLQKRFIEMALEAEMTNHLGYEKNSVEGENTDNSRNGSGSKTIISAKGDFELETPRDRDGTYA